MKNLELARLFHEMADIYELKGVKWKPRAYRTVAKALETLPTSVGKFHKKNALEEIPGVGESIKAKIIEFLKTGKIKKHDKLVKSVPKHMFVLMNVPGIGSKKAKKLNEKLKISSVKELEEACKKHKIKEIPGFGEESERDILEGIKLLRHGFGKRIPLRQAEATAKKIILKLKSSKYVKKVSTAGSLRRKKATVRDIDIMVATNSPEKVIDFFTKLPNIKKVLAKGKRKATIVMKSGIQSDIRVFPPEQWGSGLLYFTGSKAFNIEIRKAAIKKGYKLNEYGLFKGKKRIAGKTEKEIFKKLGIKFVPPEKRES